MLTGQWLPSVFMLTMGVFLHKAGLIQFFTTWSSTFHVWVTSFISLHVTFNFNIVLIFKALSTVMWDVHYIFLVFRTQCTTYANTLISKFLLNFLNDLISSVLRGLYQLCLLLIFTMFCLGCTVEVVVLNRMYFSLGVRFTWVSVFRFVVGWSHSAFLDHAIAIFGAIVHTIRHFSFRSNTILRFQLLLDDSILTTHSSSILVLLSGSTALTI